MTLEEAIKTAIEFETKVKDVYVKAEKHAKDKVGRRTFRLLADEEFRHIAYLTKRLNEWKKDGRITVEKLETAIPPRKVIEREVKKLKKEVSKKDHDQELEMLQHALTTEVETSAFYKRMVAELSAEGHKMFARFVEIEDGHIAIVQSEIDKLTGLGFWFDLSEFDLSSG